MICPNCQKENGDSVRFCSGCGFEIGKMNSEPKIESQVDPYAKTPEELEKIKKSAKILTTISICLRVFDILLLVGSLVVYVLFKDIKYIIDSPVMTAIFIISSMFCVASIVLSIVALVKVIKNKIKSNYVRITFIMHLVLLVMSLIAIVAIWTFSATTYCLDACGCNDIQNCDGLSLFGWRN